MSLVSGPQLRSARSRVRSTPTHPPRNSGWRIQSPSRSAGPRTRPTACLLRSHPRRRPPLHASCRFEHQSANISKPMRPQVPAAIFVFCRVRSMAVRPREMIKLVPLIIPSPPSQMPMFVSPGHFRVVFHRNEADPQSRIPGCWPDSKVGEHYCQISYVLGTFPGKTRRLDYGNVSFASPVPIESEFLS